MKHASTYVFDHNTKQCTCIYITFSDGYFNMTSDGSVIVAKQLPRLRLYNTGKAVLGIDVHDTGNPSLLTQVTAEIEVESKSSFTL